MHSYPKDALASPPKVISASCFVIMPFKKEFNSVLSVIQSACASPELQFSCSRADNIAKAGQLMGGILKGILASEYVVVEMTEQNLNVFYELGLAHCCKPASNVIMITQRPEELPANLRGMLCLPYQSGAAGHKKLKRNLIEAMLDDGYPFSLTTNGSYELAQILSGRNQLAYTVKIINVIVGPEDAKLWIQVKKQSVDGKEVTLAPVQEYLSVGKSVKIAPTDYNLRLNRVEGSGNAQRAFFSIVKR